MRAIIKMFVSNESGATAMEYGLIVGLVSIAAIAGFDALGTSLSSLIDSVSSSNMALAN